MTSDTRLITTSPRWFSIRLSIFTVPRSGRRPSTFSLTSDSTESTSPGRTGLPAARDEAAEQARLRRLLVQVEGLRIELARVLDDLLLRDLVAPEAHDVAHRDVLEVLHARAPGPSGRRRYMVMPTMASTTSPCWLSASTRRRTKPMGLLREGQVSSTSVRPLRVSPGRTGLSPRQEARP